MQCWEAWWIQYGSTIKIDHFTIKINHLSKPYVNAYSPTPTMWTQVLWTFFYSVTKYFGFYQRLLHNNIMLSLHLSLSTEEPCNLGKLWPCATLFPWGIMFYKWVDLCCNKTLFMSTEILISYHFHMLWNILPSI